MKLPGSRRIRIIGLVIALVIAAGGITTVMKQRAASPGEALAAADSTAVADSSDQASDTRDKKSGKKGEKKEAPPVPVELAVAAPRDIPSYFHATGSLSARSQVTLIAKAGGQVMKLSVEEGDFVRAGEVVMELDHREDKLMVDQTRVKAETAQRELDRFNGLVEKGLASDKEFEGQQEMAEVAKLEHEMAKVRLENKIVRAPFSGQVTTRHIELGQTVNVGAPLVDIADVSPLEVTLFLPEKIVNRLSVGQEVEIRSDVDADSPLMGSVERIAPAVDPATSTVKVTLLVKDESGIARVGSFVRARVTTDVVKNAVSVPKKALVPEAGVTYLFVAEADSVQKIPVTTGYADDDFIEITGGISIGDQVVTVGQGGLRPGSKIKNLTEAPDDEGRVDTNRSGEELAEVRDK